MNNKNFEAKNLILQNTTKVTLIFAEVKIFISFAGK